MSSDGSLAEGPWTQVFQRLGSTATGTDADCARMQQDGSAVPVPADRVISVTVAAGETACLRTGARGGYELLWHALAQQPTTQLMADVTSPRAGR